MAAMFSRQNNTRKSPRLHYHRVSPDQSGIAMISTAQVGERLLSRFRRKYFRQCHQTGMAVPCRHCTDIVRFLDSPIRVVRVAAIGLAIRISMAALPGLNGEVDTDRVRPMQSHGKSPTSDNRDDSNPATHKQQRFSFTVLPELKASLRTTGDGRCTRAPGRVAGHIIGMYQTVVHEWSTFEGRTTGGHSNTRRILDRFSAGSLNRSKTYVITVRGTVTYSPALARQFML
ncbi:hypothetical protein CLF_102970 [Clonorchis sinensis]|uniref:Uncharacterized protein n=1 Tax=Clonorchis sinensis TaxID=79923 RepID=G7YN96_CLOSI|nr:hypothetical protein CLF_102970 [Clonorchis sinensis]